MKKVLFISSEGGHLNELSQIDFNRYDYFLVTEKTKATEFVAEKYPKGKYEYLKYGTRKTPIRYFFILVSNYLKSKKIFKSFNPDVIVTTGTHTAIPMCFIAHRKKKKVIWIETFANRYTPTMAGKIIKKFKLADEVIVQWPELLEVYPNSKNLGSIF